MRVLFGLLAVLAVGSSAVMALPKQAPTPNLSIYRSNVGFLNSNREDAKTSTEIVEATASSAVLVPADYDGDGKLDFGTWNPSNGKWTIHRSHDASRITIAWEKTSKTRLAANQNVPVPSDFDGDGRADIAVWRSATADWHILLSTKNFDRSSSLVLSWGFPGDVPVPADYDGDSKADLAVFRPSENRWYILLSKTGETHIENFGIAGTDLLVPADYTGDGKADIAVYRRGTWFVLNSETGETEPFEFGFADATPVPADYDKDGEIDFAVYRSGTWYIYESRSPRLLSYKFGNETDLPLSSVMTKQSITLHR